MVPSHKFEQKQEFFSGIITALDFLFLFYQLLQVFVPEKVEFTMGETARGCTRQKLLTLYNAFCEASLSNRSLQGGNLSELTFWRLFLTGEDVVKNG